MKHYLFSKLIAILLITLTGCSEKKSASDNNDGTVAVSANEFLNSMGVCTSVSRRGENLQETIDNMKYTGLRWVRVGYEDNAPVEDFIELYKTAGVRSSYGLLSGHSDIERLVNEAKQLAGAGALLAIEGSNEPNNWGINYQGEFGGRDKSWVAVAKLHRDLYEAVKNDNVLKDYPVWSTCETGAQTDNVGLQFLTIPEGTDIIMPAGTKYADFANCHNYISHPSWPGLHDNQTWLSASPGKDCPVDGLYGNFGKTWLKKYQGYSDEELETLPRVTTETGYEINEEQGVTEEMQGRLYLNLYLSQFKRGWKHTAVYLLKGRSNEAEHEKFAFYKLDNTPKIAAHYMHNFTTILADTRNPDRLDKLNYSIAGQPATTHDLLLQKSNGKFYLVLWGERFGSKQSDDIKVELGENYKEVNVYNPISGTKAVKNLKDVSFVELSLTNHPLIVEITN